MVILDMQKIAGLENKVTLKMKEEDNMIFWRPNNVRVTVRIYQIIDISTLKPKSEDIKDLAEILGRFVSCIFDYHFASLFDHSWSYRRP